MIYVSIDIETTGLDNENTQTLSIGLVVEDTNNLKPFDELPKLEIAIIRERLEGEIFALNMNRDLISDILSYKIAKTPEAKAEIVERTGREYLYEEDVTKRKKQIQLLIESENKFRNLVENSAVGIYIITPKGFVFVNDSFILGSFGVSL